MAPKSAAAVLLAAAALAVGCGESGPPTVGTSIPVGVQLQPGVRVSASPGAVRTDRPGPTLIWLSTPGATLTVTTDPRGASDVSMRLANLAPETTVTPSEATYRSGNDAPDCERETTRTVDCEETDDPLCQPPTVDSSVGPATHARLAPELPGCVRVRYEINGTFATGETRAVALIGATDGPGPLPDLVDRAASRDADVAVLLGDHLASSSTDRLRALAADLASLPIPVVVTPGETERLSGTLSAFTRHFGAPTLDWQIGQIQFLAVESATGTLGDGGVERLQDRLGQLDDERPTVAVTHRPPLDPKGLRDRGFQSRIEGSRVLSVLTDEKVDLLAAGHVPGPAVESYDNVEMVVPPEGSGGELSIVELAPKGEAGGELGIEVKSKRK